MQSDNKLTNSKPRILVVLEPHPESSRLLRVAKRKAELEEMDWEVLLIETPRMHRTFSLQEKKAFLGLETLAGQMGAIVTKIHARSMMMAVKDAINDRQREGIIIYSVKVGLLHGRYSWFGLKVPLYRKLQKFVPAGIKISIIPLGVTGKRSLPFMQLLHVKGSEIVISLAAVLVAILCIETLAYLFPEVIGAHNRNKTIIFMTACAFAASRYGLVAGLVAAVSSFLAMSVLYIAPLSSIHVDDSTDAFNLALFMIASLLIALVGSRAYETRIELMKRSDMFHSLFQMHRVVLNKNTPAEAIAAFDEELKSLLKKEVAFLLPSILDEKKLETLFSGDLNLNSGDEKALKVCWEESKTTGVGAPYEPEGCIWRFEPMVTSNDEIGVLGVRIKEHDELNEDFGRLMSGIADQAALILERLQLEQTAEANKIRAEREKLRAMLLSSVSHDLKTPLASIIGSLSVYRSMGKSLSEEHRTTLLATAIDEAQRLDSFITNILDMTRIESGQIELKSEWARPKEMVAAVAKRMRDRLRNHKLQITHGTGRVEVQMDTVITGQVLQNLLDNAAKYTKHGTVIDVTWDIDEDGRFYLHVRDHGAGIPEEHLEMIFDKYARINRQDSQVAGTGLGLAIARAVMRAQGGNIVVSNHPEGGAMFTLILPEARLNDTASAA